MSSLNEIPSVQQFGHYSVTGPVKLPIKLADGTSAEFTHDGFKFPGGRYGASYLGDIRGADDLLLRVSSNCQWAFYWNSQLCDCRWQLEQAQLKVRDKKRGLIIFAHDHHGKGVPIEDHWRIYAEGQRRDLELVVDAYEQLGFSEDYRRYQEITDILKHYGVSGIRLMTNSPRRKKAFELGGIRVTALEPLEQPIHDPLKPEYRAKKHKLRHFLQVPDSVLDASNAPKTQDYARIFTPS